MTDNPVAAWWRDMLHDPLAGVLGVAGLLFYAFAAVHRLPYFDNRGRMTRTIPQGWETTQYMLLMGAILSVLALAMLGAYRYPGESE